MRVERLAEIDSSTGACAKPNCSTGSRTLHRHHVRHEAMWLGVWASRRKNEKKFQDFVARYHAFLPEDWKRICDNHHAEIHLIYDEIILQDKRITGRPLSRYSWVQAETLMDKLEAACTEWLKEETPGFDSDKLEEIRNKQRRARRTAMRRRLRELYRGPWEEYWND